MLETTTDMALQSLERNRGYPSQGPDIADLATAFAGRPISGMTTLEETAAGVLALEGTWTLAIVAPRCEKRVARQLELLGVPHYLPLQKMKRKWTQGRTMVVDVPLYPMYLPVCWREQQQWWLAREAPHVQRLMRISDQDGFRGELSNLEQALGVNPYLGARSVELKIGKSYRVVRGAFIGIEGRLIEIRGDRVFIVGPQLMGGAVPLDVAMSDIEPI